MGEPLSSGATQLTVTDSLPDDNIGIAGTSGSRVGSVTLSEVGDHGPGPTAFSARTWIT